MALSFGFCLGEAETVYTANQFSEALQAIAGNGICDFGGKFAVLATGSLTVQIASGFALAAGRWIKADEKETCTVAPANNYFDRYDAVVIRVQRLARTVSLTLITGTPSAFPQKYTPIRDEKQYELVLAYIVVKKGTTLVAQEDIEDVRAEPSLCGYILPMCKAAGDVLQIYDFLGSGIDKTVARLHAIAADILQKGDDVAQAITQAIRSASLGNAIGDLTFLRHTPDPSAEWLLCNGAAVPETYPALRAVLGDVLPNLTGADARYRAYVYGGAPVYAVKETFPAKK